ncbi:MAG: CDP-diacylglycerol--glycerol-3-phosphate 3-phosphatidyltransferase [Pseudomonadota bacterium]
MNSVSWIPNAVTLLRTLAGLVGAACLFVAPDTMLEEDALILSAAAGLLLLIAALGDWLDGWLARALKAQSAFGALIDPIADKIIVSAYLIAFIKVTGFDPWFTAPAVVIIARDLAVTGIRLSRLGRETTPLPVSAAAKWKTAVEMVVLAAPFLAVTLVYLTGLAPRLAYEAYYVWIGGVWFAALLSGSTFIGYMIAPQKNRAP